MTDIPPLLVVLAGGSNSRFWPLTGKSLLPFCGKSLIEHQLRTLVDIGFRRIVVVGNPDNQASFQRLAREFGDAVDFRVTVQHQARGMGDALLTLRPMLDGVSDSLAVYVCQVHDVFDRLLHEQMLQAYLRDKHITWLASYIVDTYFPGGYLVVDDDLNITDIIEKPVLGSEPSNLLNIVAHVHPDLTRLLDQLDVEYARDIQTDDHYERAMAQLMKKQNFKAVRYAGPWHPIKYPWHVLDVMTHYLDRLAAYISDDAYVTECVHIDCQNGPVYIGSGSRILFGASIVGPAYIGPNTLIGQYSHVRHSMIGENCFIGVGSEVNRSYIGNNTMLHNAKALDSVIAERVNLAAGVITANFRTDGARISSTVKGERIDTGRTKFGSIVGAGTFISIHVDLMPGIKVGANAIIGPATLVRSDVGDRTLHYAEQHYVTRPLSTPIDER